LDVPLLVEVAGDEALHAGHVATVEDLLVDRRKVVVRVRRELALILGLRRDLPDRSGCVRVRFVAAQPVDRIVLFEEPAEHVIERAVLHHEHDEMFEIVEAWRHKRRTPKKSCVWPGYSRGLPNTLSVQ